MAENQADTRILVIDDAKFSSAIIAKALKAGGFTQLRITDNPMEALRSMEKKSAHIVIADWSMPAMDGMSLIRKIRQLDEDEAHQTHIVLMITPEHYAGLPAAFSAGMDDFINKETIRTELLPRVLGAIRATQRQRHLLEENRSLRLAVEDLQAADWVDPTTSLGNLKFTTQRIEATLKESETRGRVACLLLIGIGNMQVIRERYAISVVNELLGNIAARLQVLLRPLDLVTHPETDLFAVTTLQDSLAQCTAQSFRRIFDSLYMQTFTTQAGEIPIVVGVSVTAADATTGYPNAETFLNFAQQGLRQSLRKGSIHVSTFDPTEHLAGEHE